MKSTLNIPIVIAVLTALGLAGLDSPFAYPDKPPYFVAGYFSRPEVPFYCVSTHTQNACLSLDFIQPAFWAAVAREEFEIGPLSLAFRIRAMEVEATGDSTSPISRIGVNTDISTSLNPLSIRIAVVLILETSRTGSIRESAIYRAPGTQKALPVGRAFAFFDQMNWS